MAGNLTPGLPSSRAACTGARPASCGCSKSRAGGCALESLDPSSGARRDLWAGLESLSGFAVARASGVTAAVRHAFDRPPEVHAGPPGKWRR